MTPSPPSRQVRRPARIFSYSTALFRRLTAALMPTMVAGGDQVAHGKYIATASNCVACHTAPGGATKAGGLPLAPPIGSVMATNTTPSKENGIGGYALEQFDAALRRGARRRQASLSGNALHILCAAVG